VTTYTVAKRLEKFILPKLKQIPLVQHYARTHGWPFVLAWGHRVAGILLVLYAWFHIYTLTLLHTPDLFDAKIKIFRFFVFVLLEWALAVPVIFHALNGGRLILYESFGNRNELSSIRWLLSLSVVYVLLVGFLMVLGSQAVSPVLFWLCMLIASVSFCYLVASQIWHTENTAAWKLQRISGSYLIIMIPAHLLFMHLQPSVAHDAGTVIIRMQNVFIKLVDLTLVAGTLYHGGYGLLSVVKDYLPSKMLGNLIGGLITAVMLAFAWVGFKLILFV